MVVSHKNRKAIAMIELIFAIVVMGIAMLAIPMISVQSSRGGDSAMMQESVAAASSELQMIMSRAWDENNTITSLGSPILVTQSANFATRAGLNVGGRTTLASDSNVLNAAAIGRDALNDSDDIDDFNGVTNNFVVYGGVQQQSHLGEYIDTQINMRATVAYASDAIALANVVNFNYNPSQALSPTTTNIKRISVNLTTANNQDAALANKDITLNAFSCNIGEAVPRVSEGDN